MADGDGDGVGEGVGVISGTVKLPVAACISLLTVPRYSVEMPAARQSITVSINKLARLMTAPCRNLLFPLFPMFLCPVRFLLCNAGELDPSSTAGFRFSSAGGLAFLIAARIIPASLYHEIRYA